ncbi:MAG: hypothetical protein D6766_07870 [Verrucomicrobia bacterium]|nr:MAG: hypothetical protein D6766_07870 [Verrucomicrobiota bacterium]
MRRVAFSSAKRDRNPGRVQHGRGVVGRPRGVEGGGALARGGRRRAGWAIWTAALSLLVPGRAEVLYSSSGQFIVHSRHPTAPTLNRVAEGPRTNQLIRLQPATVVVACERIKAAVLAELGLRDQWRGKIHVNLRTATGMGELPQVTGRQYLDGWQFSITTPDELPPRDFVRAVTAALLLETARRTPGPHPGEVPWWLIEGVTEEIQSRVGPALVPPETSLAAKIGNQIGQLDARPRDVVLAGEWAAVRQWLRERGALSFERLSLPEPGDLRGDSAVAYRMSARAFLLQLRRLPGGRLLLQRFLASLTSCLNWQTAFLGVYRQFFPTLLDVEKWWTLSWRQLAGAGAFEPWSDERALAGLAELLQAPVLTQAGPGEPVRQELVPLAEAPRRLRPGDWVRLARIRQSQAMAVAARNRGEPGQLCRELAALLEEHLRRLARIMPGPNLTSAGGRAVEKVYRDWARGVAEIEARGRRLAEAMNAGEAVSRVVVPKEANQ